MFNFNRKFNNPADLVANTDEMLFCSFIIVVIVVVVVIVAFPFESNNTKIILIHSVGKKGRHFNRSLNFGRKIEAEIIHSYRGTSHANLIQFNPIQQYTCTIK